MGGYRQLRAVAKLPVCEHAMRRQYLRAEAAGTEQRRHDMRVALGEQQALPRQPISTFAAVEVAPTRHRQMEADWIVRIGHECTRLRMGERGKVRVLLTPARRQFRREPGLVLGE